MMVYDEDGDLNEDWTFEYDNQRRLIKTIEKDIWLSNDFGYISEYTYENNKVYVVKHSIKDGTLFGRYIYEYDSKGNLLQETYISGDTDKESIEQKFEYKYDSLGRIQRKSKKHIYLITGHIMIIYITMMVQLIKYPYPIVIKMMNQS